MGAQAYADLRAGGVFGVRPAGWDLPRLGSVPLGPLPAPVAVVALSHPWAGLPPYAYDGTLHRTLALPDAGPLTVSVSDAGASWGRVTGTERDRSAVVATLRRCLAADDDLTELHSVCAADPDRAWIAGTGAGRLLRSPTVWEDCVRAVLGTNTSWSGTRAMITRLLESGAGGPAGERCFPTPAAVAAAGPDGPAGARLGYRAGAVHAFAVAVDSGRVDPERWLGPGLSDDEVRAQVLALAGFGPFTADTVLGVLGRPRRLAADRWVRERAGAVAGTGPLTDDAIRDRYGRYGRWAGTVLWLDATRPSSPLS